ncbi:MAG: twin-arginine translocation signal domain-containing protein [Pedosphaera sp.]|nr:twin-arginine translocation signal domain-containing protein [Pedosphaera sp.]
MKNDSLETHAVSRRGFLKTSGLALGAAGIAAASSAAAAPLIASGRNLIRKGDVILFQGDSITDAGRSRDKEKLGAPNNQPGLGNGYAWLAAAELLVGRPGDGLKIFNRGISGHKVFQLAERWQADCFDLKPDVLSVLIGVNDIWHSLDPKSGYKGTVEIYERDYHALVERTKQALPKIKLVICEPFVLRCGAVKGNWFPEFDKYRAAAKRMSEKHRATFVPFQAMFDEAIKYAPPEHWAGDGVHPSPAGAALMAHFWVRAVSGKG